MAIFMGLGLASCAGLNAFIPLFVISLLQILGFVSLPDPFSIIGQIWLLLIFVALYIVDFFADKMRLTNYSYDRVQTIIRPLAGLLLSLMFASVAGFSGVLFAIFGIAGAGLAFLVHLAKAKARPMLRYASYRDGGGEAGVGCASFGEDVLCVLGSIVSVISSLLALFIVLPFALGLSVFTLNKVRIFKLENPHAYIDD